MGRKTMSQLGVLGLYTETPLHCGAESGSGYVDLPIQRERHTGYPVIPGSTIKGVLRDDMQGEGDTGLSKDGIDRFFGTEDAKRPGRISFGDGILVAFPVRSSEAPFHWVTCPLVLERVGRLLGRELDVSSPGDGRAWAKEGDAPEESVGVILEEIRVERRSHPFFSGSAIEALLGLVPAAERGFAHTRSIFPHRLLVVTDDVFAELVEVATEVVTRIKLNALGTTTNLPEGEHPELQKSQREGNLFVQELVPSEALFLTPLRALEGEEGFAHHAAKLRVLRLGGDETIGRGVVHATWAGAEGDGKEGDHGHS